MKHAIRLVLVLLFAVTGTSAAGAGTDVGSSAGHRAITWEDPASGERLRGLYLIELHEDRMVSRVVTMTPDGRSILLSQTLDAPTGIRTTLLQDEQTGWRAELETATGAQAPTLSALFRAAEKVDPGEPVTVRLTLPDQEPIEARIPVDLPSQMQRKLVEQLAVTGNAGRVGDAIPEGLRPALFFLESSLSPDALASEPGKVDNVAHSLRDVVAVLAGALRAADAEVQADETHRWSMEVGPPQKGLEVQSPALRDLLARFQAEARPVEQ